MRNNLLTIENGCVIRCNEEAVNVEIPNEVTSIGEKAFEKCGYSCFRKP